MSFRRLAFVFGLLLCGPAFSAAPDCGGVDLAADPSVKPDWAAHADELVNADGLLWRIDKPGLPPSYLYGTMHSTAAGPMRLAVEAGRYAAEARTVATELGAIDSAKKIDLGADMLRAALSPDEDTFAGRIEGDDVAKVEAFLLEKGTPAEMAHHLKLWMLAVTSSLPKCEIEGQAQGLPEVDDSFVKIAQAHRAEVVGLESVEEQMQAISSIPPALAARVLVTTAENPLLRDGGYRTLLNFYVQKRPAAALAVLDAAPGLTDEDRRASAETTRLLLAGRNGTMAERAAPLLAQGGAFVAVGALHLSGKGGLIELVRGKGYEVTKVW